MQRQIRRGFRKLCEKPLSISKTRNYLETLIVSGADLR